MTKEDREAAIKNILKATQSFVKENEGKIPQDQIAEAVAANMRTIEFLIEKA